jgi:hypothetical protein
MRSGFVGSYKVNYGDFLSGFKAATFCCTDLASHYAALLGCGATPDSSDVMVFSFEGVFEAGDTNFAGFAQVSSWLRIVFAAASFQKKHFGGCPFAGGVFVPVS